MRELVNATPEPRAIAVDADDVYWIDALGGYQVAKSAAAPVDHPAVFAATYRQPNTPGPDCPGKSVAPGVLALTADAMVWTLWDHCSQFQPWGPMLWVAPKVPQGGTSTWGEGSALRDWEPRGGDRRQAGDRRGLLPTRRACRRSSPSILRSPTTRARLR